MATARVGDITINYEVHGEGEPLLMINGLADDLTSWAFQTEAFAKHYRTIVFDNRGIGATDKPAGRYTTAPMRAACSTRWASLVRMSWVPRWAA